MGYRWELGNGRKVRLWEDNCLGSSSLAIQFWPLYRIVNGKGKTIPGLWKGTNLKWSFRRNVSEELYNSWLERVDLVSTIQFSEEEDEMVWQFTPKGIYASQSLYKIIKFRGVKPVHFQWLVTNNKVLSRDNLAKRREVEDPIAVFSVQRKNQYRTCFLTVLLPSNVGFWSPRSLIPWLVLI